MDKTLTLIGGDRRFLFVKEYFEFRGFLVNTLFLGEKKCEEISDTVILPVPVTRNGFLNAPLCKEELCENDLVDLLPENSTVFGGMPTDFLMKKCEEKGIRFTDYYKDEILLEKNALFTAEAVHFVLNENGLSEKDGNIFILGYGRTGKAIADVISSRGGNVTVVTGKDRIDKYRFIHFNSLSDNLQNAYLVINTVPSTVLGETQLSSLKTDAVIIEIASAPYGVDFEAAKRLGIKVIKAPSLPGKYFPKEAGEAIAQTILRR
jgi:dipicolinate synthase subunit A